MKTKIEEVKTYFKSKILSSDFKILNIDEYRADLVVDGEFHFIFWVGNIYIPETRKQDKSMLSFMDLNFSDSDAIELDILLAPTINKFRKETLLIEKMKEVERLRAEIN